MIIWLIVALLVAAGIVAMAIHEAGRDAVRAMQEVSSALETCAETLTDVADPRDEYARPTILDALLKLDTRLGGITTELDRIFTRLDGVITVLTLGLPKAAQDELASIIKARLQPETEPER